METVMDAPVVSLTTTPHINKVEASAKVEATIEYEYLVKPAILNPPEMSHPDEYKTILVDAHTTIEFDDDEVQPNTDKDWISYLNKHSSSITWYFNDEYSDL